MNAPNPLRQGDRIAILSPASPVIPELIDGAARRLADEGFEPVVMPHAKGPAAGSYAASDSHRLQDIVSALQDPSIRAIFCARGGYGCNRLLHDIPLELIAKDPKWLVGFSDISALHALWNAAGLLSLHGPMARHLTRQPNDDSARLLLHLLATPIEEWNYRITTASQSPESPDPSQADSRRPDCPRRCAAGIPSIPAIPPSPHNRPGKATGRLIGGNLAVLSGLASTPFDPFAPLYTAKTPNGAPREPIILFIEDVGEKIYAIERMLIRLSLAGALQNVAGLIVGEFTQYQPDANFRTMEEMIAALMARPAQQKENETPFPILYGFPAGHAQTNIPLPLGAQVALEVTPTSASLSLADPKAH